MASNTVSLLKLIKDGAPLEVMTPILKSLSDHGELLSTLIEKDDGGITPLHHAMLEGSLKVVNTLLHEFNI